MNLSATAHRLHSPAAFPLNDASASWESVYSASAGIWNQYMAGLQINTYASNNTNGGQTGISVNEAFFGSSLGGSNLDSNTLGLTICSYDPTTNAMIEADTAFSPSFAWNSYRGALQSNGVIDFRRVAIHEFLERYVTDEQTQPPAHSHRNPPGRGQLAVFPRCSLFTYRFRYDRRSRLEKQPTDLRRKTCSFRGQDTSFTSAFSADLRSDFSLKRLKRG
jgi:hypothetical protein